MPVRLEPVPVSVVVNTTSWMSLDVGKPAVVPVPVTGGRDWISISSSSRPVCRAPLRFACQPEDVLTTWQATSVELEQRGMVSDVERKQP